MSADPIAQSDCTADPCATCTWSCWLRGIASMNAMSWLERFPQAQTSRSAAQLEAQRIVHPQGKLGVAEVLSPVDVVEEIVQPAARDRRPAVREAPGERRLHPRRDGEEVLVREFRPSIERARHVKARDPRAEGEGE